MAESEKQEDTKEEKSKQQTRNSGGSFASFQNKFFIDLSKELEDFSTPHLKAYATGQKKNKTSDFFTIICHSKLTPRTNITTQYQKVDHPSLPTLVNHGRCVLPNGKAAYCYIYKNNMGNRIYKNDTDIALGWRTDAVIERLLIPIAMLLNDLQQRDLTHGNIRLTNLYDGGIENGAIKLGDCLASPSAYHQPAVYEPIERAMASPIGRGEGTAQDDLYALGVILAMHVRNFDPLRGKTHDDIIATKVVNGSYGTIISTSDRIPSGITDLIRGLLTDDPKNRWTMEDVLDWLDGRRQNVKSAVKVKKAARAITFNGTQFFYARTLAYRMMQHQEEAIQLVEGNELMHWIERSVSDSDLVDRMEMAFRTTEDKKGAGYWDKILPLISIALDPKAPIRYRNFSMHLDAIGNTMAENLVDQKNLNDFVSFFKSGVMHFWITILADLNVDITEYSQKLEKVKKFLKKNDIVGGIERCFYFLNPSIHCMSPIVSEYFATDPKGYLLALEKAAENQNGSYPYKIIDKHSACFLISRDSGLITQHAFDLSSNLEFRHVLATIKVLASIQRFNKVEDLPHVTDWLCNMVDPIIRRYHDQENQKQIKKEIEKNRSSGDINKILNIIDNPEKVKTDQVMFRRAIAKYRELDNEKTVITKKLEKPKFFAERTGREWAATISGVVSSLIILGFLMLHYSGGPL